MLTVVDYYFYWCPGFTSLVPDYLSPFFFKKRGYPDSAVSTGKHRAQEIDRETALQTSQNEETDRIPFTLTYHPQNLAIKNIILRNFKILRNDPETGHMFSLPPLISFKRDKNLGNFLVGSAFKPNWTNQDPLHSHINHNNPQFLYSLWRRANARNVSFPNLSRW